MEHADLLLAMYEAFNAREIDSVLLRMSPDVDWPNAWEGGRVHGHEAVRDYWTRQWSAINPTVEPIGFAARSDGSTAVEVRQVTRNLEGTLLGKGRVLHVYVFDDDLVARMDVEELEPTPLAGGQLLAAISNRIVAILRENYGRGPMNAKTYAHDDLIVVVLRGMGFTPLERTMMDSGDPDRVVEMRHDFQRIMTERYKQTIEELTGRKVVAFLSQAHVEPDITMESFFLDQPLKGFGVVEITDPGNPSRS